MRQNNIFYLYFLLLFVFPSCIKQFDPEIRDDDSVKIVVTGQVIKGNQVQQVNVSTTTIISKFYRFSPIVGCDVSIHSNRGKTYTGIDMNDGNYNFYIPNDEIRVGDSFKVEVYIHKSGVSESKPIHIVSDFDQLNECPDVDSIYYLLDSLPSNNALVTTQGIRFYADVDAGKMNSSFFRFEATETWEYHAKLARPGSPQRICWMTKKINDIFALSTQNLTQNKYKKFPLHFVDNVTSQRLVWGYSLFVKQYAMSEEAFQYWEKIRINSVELGGLYGKQPLVIKGNMHNITNPDQPVLGFFGASSVKSKRIFVGIIPNLPLIYEDCQEVAGPPPPDPKCFNCLLEQGGSNLKPVFWPY